MNENSENTWSITHANQPPHAKGDTAHGQGTPTIARKERANLVLGVLFLCQRGLFVSCTLPRSPGPCHARYVGSKTAESTTYRVANRVLDWSGCCDFICLLFSLN